MHHIPVEFANFWYGMMTSLKVRGDESWFSDVRIGGFTKFVHPSHLGKLKWNRLHSL